MQRISAKFIGRYLPLIIWIAFISFASSDEFSAGNTSRFVGAVVLWLFPHASPETLSTVHFLTRKTAHLTEYAILGFLAARAFYGSQNRTLQRNWFIAGLALIVVYALVDEYHQSFVPSRTASIFDSMIDVAGGLAALGIFHYHNRRN
jgi:VanZ family protein